MANSRNRCTGCKCYFKPETMEDLPIGKFCTRDCAIEYSRKPPPNNKKKVEKLRNKEHALRTRIFYASDLKTRKKGAIIACHNYIRERDKNKRCITCGVKLAGTKFDAGHFVKAGNHAYTRFMEKNIHGQCVQCNMYQGGEELKYYQFMIDTYGLLTAKALLRVRFRPVKRTCEDYKAIEDYYKLKIKQLETQ